jgi:hypothetical protein
MADHEDEIMDALAHAISDAYTILVDVCLALPVPIMMPMDQHIPTSEAVPAIRRVAELAAEQPMGEEQEALLYSGCVYLLSAIDLYALCAARFEPTRADGVGSLLLHADDVLGTLHRWLLAHN